MFRYKYIAVLLAILFLCASAVPTECRAMSYNPRNFESLDKDIIASIKTTGDAQAFMEMWNNMPEEFREAFLKGLDKNGKRVMAVIVWKCLTATEEAAGGNGNGCILPGTKVLMADGSYRDISGLKVGDMVRSYNIKEGRIAIKRITEKSTNKSVQHYVINGSLRVTAGHPFLIPGPVEVWKKTSELCVGDKVKSSGGDVTIRSIEKVAEKSTVYNFRVADSHNYFVSDGVTNYLVRNGGK